MNFRKVVFALATAGLGLTGIASAQVTCTGASATPAFLRAEGTTELAPAINITGCSIGATNPGTVSITLSTTAGVANLPTSSSTSNTDAQALFNGGTPVAGVVTGNTLVFNNVPVPAGAATLTINNVRVNASQVPPNTNVTATVAATSNLILSNSSNITIGYTQAAVAKPIVAGYTNQPICSAGLNVVPILAAQISAAFNGAFSPEANGTGATTGDLFVAVNFGNLLPGVNYYVPINAAGLSAGVGAAALVTDTKVPTPTAAKAVNIPSDTNNQIGGVAQLTVTNGTATALYHLTGQTNAAQSFQVILYALPTSSAAAGATSPSTVSANLVSPASGYDQFSTTQSPTAVAAAKDATGTPAFTNVSITPAGGTATVYKPNDLGELASCGTTMLFPYILNAGGYDTGIALTNASAGATVAQNGTCSVQFFGTGAPSKNPYVTDSINAGTVGAFTVSSVASGFVGYAIATCNFQNAHGFAFITDGYGQAGRGLSQGYLAIVTAQSGGGAVTPSAF